VQSAMLEKIESKRLIDPDVSFFYKHSEVDQDSFGFLNPGNLLEDVDLMEFNQNDDLGEDTLEKVKPERDNPKQLKLLEESFEYKRPDNLEKEFESNMHSEIIKKPNRFLRSIVKDEIMFKKGLKNVKLSEHVQGALEVDRGVLKDTQIFDALLGFDKMEKKLRMAGLVMSPSLSFLLRYSSYMSQEQVELMSELPEFHFILEGKYREEFWSYGKG
jgi:hypothetical protein